MTPSDHSIISILETPVKNFQGIEVLGLKVWFSYKTPVAFQRPGTKLVFYDLGPFSRTTSRHISQLTSREEFEAVPVASQVFAAWLYEELRNAVKTYAF